jgi:hypothetical protein
MTEVIITKQQLEGLLAYYKMFGVDEMKFDKETLDDSIQAFGPTPININFGEPRRACCLDFIS